MTRVAHDELVDRVRKWGPRLARAITLLFVLVGVIAFKFGEHLERNANGLKAVVHTQARLIATLEERQRLGCHRTNVERRVSNLQNYADFKFFSFTYRVMKAAAERPSRPQSLEEREVARSFITGLGRDIALKAYVPLTFCSGARGNPRSLYAPPTPVTFASVNGRPPGTAFRLQSGQ